MIPVGVAGAGAFSPSVLSPPPPRRSLHLRPARCAPAAPPPVRIAFACGGSGGSVYPAIALADEFLLSRPSAEILFLGSPNGLQSTASAAAGHSFLPIPPNATAFFHAILALRRFRPSVVIGTGGGPLTLAVLFAAVLLRVTLVIQEQNSFPSLTHRIIEPFAAKIFLAFNGCVRHFPKAKHKCIVYGNPVRASIRMGTDKFAARSHFFDHFKGREVEASGAEVVLLLAGSVGAPPINIAMLNVYHEMLTAKKNRYIIWQTGAKCFSEMESLVKNSHRVLLTPFLHEMGMAYAAADVVVATAGAMICTEILATGKPAILVPSSTAPDSNELRNAYIMADLMGAKVITEDELDSSTLDNAIEEILGDKNLMEDMSEKAFNAVLPNATVNIVRYVLSLIDESS